MARSASTALAAALALTTLAVPSHACWDGYVATVGRVTIVSALGESSDWSLDRARDVATWSRRIERVLPAHTSLEVQLGGGTSLCTPEGKELVCRDGERWASSDLGALFRLVAKEVRATPATRKAANTPVAEIFTVQVLASRKRESAEALARKLGESAPDVGGFYDEGGHPGLSPSAHVVEAPTASGGPLYRVVAGAYLTRDDADAARGRIERSTGVRGFARKA